MAARLRAITTDWDAGFRLTPEAKPLADVPPGGEYVVECTPQGDVVLHDVTVRDFALDRLYVGTLFANIVADEAQVATGSTDDRCYRLEPPVPIAKNSDIRAVLKNLGSTPKKPKVAVLLRAGQEIAGSVPKDWRVVGVRDSSAPQPLAPSCPTCDSPDRDVRRQIGGGAPGSFCADVWHGAEARKVAGHAPKLSRTLYEGPGNATLVNGCSCGAGNLVVLRTLGTQLPPNVAEIRRAMTALASPAGPRCSAIEVGWTCARIDRPSLSAAHCTRAA